MVISGNNLVVNGTTVPAGNITELSSDGYSIVKQSGNAIKNQCTAWVNFDGTTTPPTIRDSYNVASVVRTATGYYDIYFATPMDNTNYSVSGTTVGSTSPYSAYTTVGSPTVALTTNKVTVSTYSAGNGYLNHNCILIQFFGGKNV